MQCLQPTHLTLISETIIENKTYERKLIQKSLVSSGADVMKCSVCDQGVSLRFIFVQIHMKAGKLQFFLLTAKEY